MVLYLLLNACYTKAVFTDPGSPLNSSTSQRRGKYSVLPTSDPVHDFGDIQTITVSSSGSSRYCKKCHVSKPDRTHHCSTCKRCVLKMDHHCPWLATCLGLHNYKVFILFLIYTCLFCWAAFANSARWVYAEIFSTPSHFTDQLAPVNVIMLAVLSGIIGLVLTGFTAWHLYLCVRGQTTIECLEKTRYLSGVRRQIEQNRQARSSHSREESEGIAGNLKRAREQILEFHANAVPGASRIEEGEEHLSPTPSVDREFRSQHEDRRHQSQPSTSTISSSSESPAQRALRSNYSDLESQRDHDRYEEYLDEKETSSLPNAFDLGWRKNLTHIFGPNPLLWGLPVCNTTGDGWRWEVSQKWVEAQAEVSRKKEERLRNAAAAQQNQIQHHNYNPNQQYSAHLRGGGQYYNQSEDPSYAPSGHSDSNSNRYANSAMSMQTLTHQRSSATGGGRTMRRDYDATGEDGEIATFEVSGSEVESDSDSDSDSNVGNDDNNDNGDRSRDGRTNHRMQDEGWGREW